MKISTILDHIDSGHMALPEFQRGYVWNREQVRGMFDSLYKRLPIGSLLVWATESKTAAYRGNANLVPGIVKLLLDGQQRITSIYGVARGVPPKFFDGNENAFKDLRFNLESETFAFYQPVKMKDNMLWVDVTNLMKNGQAGHESLIESLAANPEMGTKAVKYSGRISRILGILDIDLHAEEITGKDKTLDVVVDIFNRVNSGGTKLSKGDLALARICTEWPEARDKMKSRLKIWEAAGFNFNLDWLLRSVNTVLTGEAKFQYLHDKNADEIKNGLKKAGKYIDKTLNMISGRLGLDHDQVLFGRYAIPVIVRYLDKHNGSFDEKSRDKLLFWFVQAGMWGRFSSSTESSIDQDLAAIEGPEGSLNKLLEQLRLWHGGFNVESGHFTGWSRGARFYPVLYLLTRMGDARDWGSGLPLKANLLGKMNSLEVHHIFPKSQLYKYGYKKAEINAIANFCLLTKDTNLKISNRFPKEYFPEIEQKHPGALASQWVPMDESLWEISKYREFMEERKKLLAAEANRVLSKLLHGEKHWLEKIPTPQTVSDKVVGSIASEEEEQAIKELNEWIQEQGLPAGIVSYGFTDKESGEQKAIFDLAWPNGMQEDLSQPIAVLINEEDEILGIAGKAGYRIFTTPEECKKYVSEEILAVEVA